MNDAGGSAHRRRSSGEVLGMLRRVRHYTFTSTALAGGGAVNSG